MGLPTYPDDPTNPGNGGATPASYGTIVFDLNFTKLDATSRGAAVRRAREIGLLPAGV